MRWLDEIEWKWKAATPGQWTWGFIEGSEFPNRLMIRDKEKLVLEACESADLGDAAFDMNVIDITNEDMEFIASSPEMIAKLIAAVRMAEKALGYFERGSFANDSVSSGYAKHIRAKLQSGEFGEGDA